MRLGHTGLKIGAWQTPLDEEAFGGQAEFLARSPPAILLPSIIVPCSWGICNQERTPDLLHDSDGGNGASRRACGLQTQSTANVPLPAQGAIARSRCHCPLKVPLPALSEPTAAPVFSTRFRDNFGVDSSFTLGRPASILRRYGSQREKTDPKAALILSAGIRGS